MRDGADVLEPAPDIAPPGAGPSRSGPVLVGIIGVAAFLIVQLPVSDLHAAQARARAAGQGVGLLYWLSWFGGSAPGQYSIVTPALSALFSAPVVLAAATLAICFLAAPAVAGSPQAGAAAYFVVSSALANLWSGRLAFAVGAAVALAAFVLLRARRTLLAGVAAAVAALASPLAPVFLILGLVGAAAARPEWRRPTCVLAAFAFAGLLAPAVLFGTPGTMPFAFCTMATSLAGVLAAACVPMRWECRSGLLVTAAAVLGCYLVPNGIGENIQRYVILVVPPLVWALARARRRVILLGVLPALLYSAFGVATDVTAALRPSASASYYDQVRAELVADPLSLGHRVEVIDTTTHAASDALVPAVYLARGWEVHDDAANNPIFYTPNALTPASYRAWLDLNAVGLIAVPAQPAQRNKPERDLVESGLSYLRLAWASADWRVYEVRQPTPIVGAPAMLVDSGPNSLTIDVAEASAVTIRVRPSRYLTLVPAWPGGEPVCIVAAGEAAVIANVPSGGVYRLLARFSLRSVLDGLPLMTGSGSGC